MTKAVYMRFIAVIIAVVAVYTAVFIYFYTDFNADNTKKDMISALRVIEQSVNYNENIAEQINLFKDIYDRENMRITVIDRKGNVIADTEGNASEMDNHMERPEITKALKSNQGMDIRLSDTLGIKMLYIAMLGSNNDYIYRIAIPYTNRLIFMKAVLPACILTVIITLIFAFVFGRSMAKSITEPLMELTNEIIKINVKSEVNLKHYKYDELNYIARAVNILSDRVEKGLKEITDINNRTEYILDNMNNGFVILDNMCNVISINKAAMDILRCRRRKKICNIVRYTRNTAILDAVEDAAEKGINSLFDITLEDERIISVHVSAIKKGVIDEKGGVILLFVDVTSERKSYEMRQSFFSNASHELKTPITSIKGYSELLTSPVEYSDEQKKEFIERIQKESDNLTSLINDILTISRIESGKGKNQKEIFNVKTEIGDILKELAPSIEEKALSTELYCKDIVIYEEKNKIISLISNLIGNAVKYNVYKGKIFVTVAYINNKLSIEVSDTGIGIPRHEQQRIFERFYRVDKGRSKKIAGTGLGLAIVKHITAYYNGTIDLESEQDKGTTIRVVLNNINTEKTSEKSI